MPLPLPTLSFTIPSIHDDTVLQCRVYHPACLSPTRLSQITTWNKKAAIVAHPYAVLGGCYDDPVVDLYLTSSILRIYTDPSLEEVLGHQKAALLTSRSLSRMTTCPSSDS